MRLEVTIPDTIFRQARRIAETNGVSVERFVVEAVQTRARNGAGTEESLKLTEEQIAIIRKGQAEIKAGKSLTMDQVKERSVANKAAWLRENEP